MVRTEHGGEGLCGIEEGRSLDGIVIFGIDGDVDKGLVEGIEEGASGGDGGSRHGEGCRFGNEAGSQGELAVVIMGSSGFEEDLGARN